MKINLSVLREIYKINLNECFERIRKLRNIIMEPTFKMNKHQIQEISDILYTESNAKAVSYINSLQTEDELFLLMHYQIDP